MTPLAAESLGDDGGADGADAAAAAAPVSLTAAVSRELSLPNAITSSAVEIMRGPGRPATAGDRGDPPLLPVLYLRCFRPSRAAGYPAGRRRYQCCLGDAGPQQPVADGRRPRRAAAHDPRAAAAHWFTRARAPVRSRIRTAARRDDGRAPVEGHSSDDRVL